MNWIINLKKFLEIFLNLIIQLIKNGKNNLNIFNIEAHTFVLKEGKNKLNK